MPGEFDLIRKHFARPVRRARLGVGDDCALIAVADGLELAVSTDMLAEGTHFLAGTDAGRLGHKTLAVNLSDLAAMGARPRYATLALALPQANDDWLTAFARGFFALAHAHDVELIGGDTTRGPRNLCVTVFGEIPAGRAIRRAGAQAGDDIWVSGTLGDAALGLAHLRATGAPGVAGTASAGSVDRAAAAPALDRVQAEYAVARLEAPTPRVQLGLALHGLASAMLDLSDGLAGDLCHLAKASQLDAMVQAAALPLAPLLAPVFAGLSPEQRLGLIAGGGDDYELCFTAAQAQAEAIQLAGRACGVPVTKIGTMTTPRGAPGAVLIVDAAGNPCTPTVLGYDHFGNRP